LRVRGYTVLRLLLRKLVRSGTILVILCVLNSHAHADVFAFKDLEGYVKCLETDHLVETITTKDGAQTRLLGAAEIQLRCSEAAVKLLAGTKDKDKAIEFVKTTKRLSAWDNAAELVGVAADAAVPTCNELALYEVLTHVLRAPREHNQYFTKAKVSVKKCLKDKTFKSDFLEEKDSQDKTLAANACAILLEEKLVKACK
jgi:hypothetical protein